ncbi:MAG: DUF1453 domain-containing protein [Limisphaerales bacterium]
MNKLSIYIVIGALIAWRLYRRIRRNIGRQQLQPRRSVFRLVMICLAGVFVSVVGLHHPIVLAGFGAGIAAGAILGFAGLRLTRFETTEAGHFYTPDTRIGVGLSVLVLGRIIYRQAALTNHATAIAPGQPPPMGSPLTFFIFGLSLGYSIVYYIGLLVHTHDKSPASVAASSPPAAPLSGDEGSVGG